MSNKKEKGSALLTALFITVIVALVATTAAYHFRLVAHWASMDIQSTQLTLYATDIVNQVEQDLEIYNTDWQHPSSHSHFLIMPVSIGPAVIHDSSVITAHIVDANSLFNINNLLYPNTQQGFLHLLSYVLPNQTQDERILITNNIVDWLSPRTNNNADQLYADRDPPYRAAHRPMQDISELHQVAGITPDIFNAIKPYMTAIPISLNSDKNNNQPTPVNINTAAPLVLLATSPELTLEQAQQLYNCRVAHGVLFTTSDISKMCFDQSTTDLQLTNSSVVSNYFFVISKAAHKNQNITLTTLISTHKINNNIVSSYIIWQAQGE